MKKIAILICLTALGVTGIIQILYGLNSTIRIDSHYRRQLIETVARSDMPTESISRLAGLISEMEAMWDRPILVGGITLVLAAVAFVLYLRRDSATTPAAAQPSEGANTTLGAPRSSTR